jgi:hypothetical protein
MKVDLNTDDVAVLVALVSTLDVAKFQNKSIQAMILRCQSITDHAGKDGSIHLRLVI